tara:strand:+ start:279 stop:428 length:150 start_codon:yes stop_codon:yes gene_type:complete
MNKRYSKILIREKCHSNLTPTLKGGFEFVKNRVLGLTDSHSSLNWNHHG